LRIVELRAENFKRLKAIEIKPDAKDNLVIISGKNDAGKTSALDIIWAVLGGKKALKEIPKPIREGEKEAMGFLDLGEFEVTRHWTSNENSYLKVENKEGFQAKSPQKLIDAFLGKFTFDPLGFKNLSGPEQKEILLDMVGLKKELQDLEENRKKTYETRTDVERQLKTARAQFQMQEFPDDLPEESIQISNLLDQYKNAQKWNKGIDLKKINLENLQDNIQTARLKISQFQKEIKKLQGRIISLKSEKDTLNQYLTENPTIHLEFYEKKISEAEHTNRLIQEKESQGKLIIKIHNLETISENLTEKLRKLIEQKYDKLSQATMPIPGLSVSNDNVIFNGIPLPQQGSATQLKVCMAIAMAMNPKLRVIRITDGSLLDEENQKIIEEMTKTSEGDEDWQIWEEVVDESGKMGFYIESGEVVEKN